MLDEISYSGPIPHSICTQKDPVSLPRAPIFPNVFTQLTLESSSVKVRSPDANPEVAIE